MIDWGRSFRFCLQYWTRLPSKGVGMYLQPADFRRSMVFLPFVGLLTGLFMAGLAFLGSLTSSMLVAAAFAIAGGSAFTGGIFIDGVADLTDAGRHRDRRRMLESMRHKRVKWRGTAAIAANILLQTVLTYLLLDRIDVLDVFRYLPLAGLLGNYSVVLIAFLFHSISVDDAEYRFIEGTRKRELALATFFTLLVLFLLLGWRLMLFVFPLSLLPCLPFGFYWNRRLQGINRDVLGLAHEVTITFSLVALLIFVAGWGDWFPVS